MRTENGYQFAHVEWASKAGAKKKTTAINGKMSTRDKSWSARDIADEAERVEGACGHVDIPQAPGLLYGVMPHAAVDKAEKWAAGKSTSYEKTLKDGSKKTITRGYRDDAPIMSCGVVSFPRERLEDWDKFKTASVDWLKQKYDDRLISVIEHNDEAHPHLHFYCVPLAGEDFGAVHDGYKTSRTARGNDNKIRSAFKTAMKNWQDDFHAVVGSKFDLDRIGPARKRKSRDDALNDAKKRQAEDAIKEAENTATSIVKNATKTAHILIETAQYQARQDSAANNAERIKIDAALDDAQAKSGKQLASVMRQLPISNVLRALDYEFDVDTQGYVTECGYARENNGAWVVENWTGPRQPRNCIDMIMGLRGIDAAAAVDLIADACGDDPKPQPLPERNNAAWDHVRRYLVDQRGITADIVDRLKSHGFVYANINKSNKNAVFLLGDDHKKGAELRGTCGIFHGTRGEKACFHLPPAPGAVTGLKVVLVAESAIEAMSLQSMYPGAYCMGAGGSNYKKTLAELEKMKLKGYKIITAMNNDDAGRNHAAALKSHADHDIVPPTGNDWNDALRAKAAVPPPPFAAPAPAPVEAPKPAVKPSALSIFDEYPKLAHLTTKQRRAVLGGIEQVLTDQPAQLALFERIGQIEYLRDVMARMTSERLQSLANIDYERTASISSWSDGPFGPR